MISSNTDVCSSTIAKGVPDEDELEVVLQQTLTNGTLGLRDRTILEVYNATGISRSKLFHLDICDIDFKY